MSALAKGYSIYGYGKMIADRDRMNAYVRALQTAVKPGCVVLDIGTGTGIFALLSCKFGARKVYAIEPSNAIQVGKEIATANGYSDRIEFIQDLSTQVTLPEPADVIISDLRGVLPCFQHHIPAIKDARCRHLAPHGVLIPQSDTIWATVVSAPDLYEEYTSVWDSQPYGFDMQAAKQRRINSWGKGNVAPEQFLTEPRSWATIDYTTVESPNLKAELTCNVAQTGMAHGISMWFDATLSPNTYFSNAPGKPDLVYGRAFFPFSEPIGLETGETILINLQANLVADDYVWGWATRAIDKLGKIKADFRQSTFFGTPISPDRLRKLVA
jgi:protein arginine N-methyltransferase 1